MLDLVEIIGGILVGLSMLWGIQRYRRLALEQKTRPNLLIFGLLLFEIILVTVDDFFVFSHSFHFNTIPLVPACILTLVFVIEGFRGKMLVEKVTLPQILIGILIVIFAILSNLSHTWFLTIAFWTLTVLGMAALVLPRIVKDPRNENASLYLALASYWGLIAVMQVLFTAWCSNCGKTLTGYFLVTAIPLEAVSFCLCVVYILSRQKSRPY